MSVIDRIEDVAGRAAVDLPRLRRIAVIGTILVALGLSVFGAGPAFAATATTTTITSVTPEPSVVGQSVTVQYVVLPNDGSGTPTGTVTVTDGTVSCTGTVAGGQCQLTFTSAGIVILTASYSGDADFDPSTSAPVQHQIDPAATTTTIVSDNPDPSSVGEPVTVVYTVEVDAPGSGVPTGTVTVTDGVISCTGTVGSGQCTLIFTSEGARTLTATYTGDSNFMGSTSAPEPHMVNTQTPTGACCLPTGECIVVSQSDCTAQGGIYQGDSTACVPNPCTPPTPAEGRTWGRIKSIYR